MSRKDRLREDIMTQIKNSNITEIVTGPEKMIFTLDSMASMGALMASVGDTRTIEQITADSRDRLLNILAFHNLVKTGTDTGFSFLDWKAMQYEYDAYAAY